jgi:hypothetical protein
VDKATLVRSDLDIGGQVLVALSRAKIPVTLCDWNYVPELDEWQLIIATPWYDKRGPHEANAKIISVLQDAGIYADVPIRRLFVRSPQDPLVKALEREVKTQTEGTIHIVASTRQNHSVQYSLVFAPFTGLGGAMPAKHISGPEQLREFLEEYLHIGKSDVDEALTELNRKPSTSIFHVRLTKREARNLGLA